MQGLDAEPCSPVLERQGHRDQVRCHSGFRPRTRQAVRPTGIRKRSITNSSAMSESCHLVSATRFEVEAALVALGPYPGGDLAHRWRSAQLLACPWSVGDTLGPSVAHTGSGYSAATDTACAGLSIQRWASWKRRHQRDRYRRSKRMWAPNRASSGFSACCQTTMVASKLKSGRVGLS